MAALSIKQLKKEYIKRRPRIKKRIKEFSSIRKASDKKIFRELCFCILTPQTKAINSALAVKKLKDALFKGNRKRIAGALKHLVRFHNNKAGYIIEARANFKNIKKAIKDKNSSCLREWLVKNIKGIGYKEASHFLRNIGRLDKGMAIFDRHILLNLKQYGIIGKIPAALNRKNYLKAEEKMRSFSKRVNIPMQELDLLFWSIETGYIFK